MNNDKEIRKFVKINSDYYIRQFQKIGNSSKLVISFNFFAALFGPIWFGARNLWNYALIFLILETFTIVQVVRGFFGNVSVAAQEKIEGVEATIIYRKQQLEAAIKNDPENIEVFKRSIFSLEEAARSYKLEAKIIEENAVYIAIFGLISLVIIKLIQGLIANNILEKKFSYWLSDSSISTGMKLKNYLFTIFFTFVIVIFTVIHYSFPGNINFLNNFPTHPDIRLVSINWIEKSFKIAVVKGDSFFDGISFGI